MRFPAFLQLRAVWHKVNPRDYLQMYFMSVQQFCVTHKDKKQETVSQLGSGETHQWKPMLCSPHISVWHRNVGRSHGTNGHACEIMEMSHLANPSVRTSRDLEMQQLKTIILNINMFCPQMFMFSRLRPLESNLETRNQRKKLNFFQLEVDSVQSEVEQGRAWKLLFKDPRFMLSGKW